MIRIFARICRVPALLTLLMTCGCGGTLPATPTPPIQPPTSPAGPVAAKGIWVIEDEHADFFAGTSDKILRFDATADGVVAPTQTIVGPAGYLMGAVAVNAEGEIYVSGWTVTVTDVSPTTIFAYAPGASGTATPIRTIQSTALPGSVMGMAFDSAGQLYVSQFGGAYGSAAVFAKGVSGSNVTPVRTLNFDAAGVEPLGMAIGKDGTMYISDMSANARVVAFAPGANGSPLPIRSISGTSTGIEPYIAEFALDSSDNLYISSIDPVSGYGTVNVFAAGSNGNISPMKTLGGKALGVAGGIEGIQVDALGTVYGIGLKISSNGDWLPECIFSYASSASGNEAPTTKITSPQFDLTFFGAIALN